jgi:hypothetical protein
MSDNTTLAELAEQVKARTVPPSTFARLGGGRLDPAAWLTRLDKAAERLEAEIHQRGARTFTELMVVLEKSYCQSCEGRAAECPIADYLAKSNHWHDTEWCPLCFGRFAYTIPILKDEKVAGQRRVYVESEPYLLLGKSGKGFLMCRCECKPAKEQYGQDCHESPTARQGLCAVKRWHVERAVMDKTYVRWQAEAVKGSKQ